jgi:hypothetical protein
VISFTEYSLLVGMVRAARDSKVDVTTRRAKEGSSRMFRLLQRPRVSRITSFSLVLAVAALTFFGLSATGGGAASAGSSSPLGVYVGAMAPAGVSAFGRALGHNPTFAMDFLDGDTWSDLVNSAPTYMADWKNSGYTMIWGLPMLPDDSSSEGYTLVQGAAGAYNSYFLQLAQDMVAGGQGSSVIRPGWEFNGGWFPWAANGQAAAFVGYWQQIVNTMRSVPGQDFTFEWNPTAGDQGVGNLANFYPGNAYVDYIGLDLYDQAWGTYPGIASQWNTYLTEPYGLNWLASFAASEGKPITLPEWGLGEGPSNSGGAVSDPGNEVSGGDDPAFINDMAQWIRANNVYEATFWQFGSGLLSPASNPNSYAAFLLDFGTPSSTSSGSASSAATTTSTTATTATTTTTTTTTSSTSSGASGGGGETSSSGASSSPSQSSAFPQSGQAGSTVTVEGPGGPVPTWRGARFSAVVTTATSGTSGPSGSVTWAITSASGATVPCRSGNDVVHRGNGVTRCNVGPGVFTAGNGPYTVSATYPGSSSGTAATSASLTQPVAKAPSRTRIRTASVVQAGGSAVISAAVLGQPSSVGMTTGTVTFAISGASGQTLSCVGGDTVSLVSGAATCTTTTAATAGSPYGVTAAYGGDGTFAASTSRPKIIRVR